MIPFIPNSIEELLDERIQFCQSFLESVKDNHLVVSDFHKALTDFEYCKKLLIHLRANPQDERIKRRFKQQAFRIIFEISHAIKKQLNECICLHGVVWPTETESYAPQETKDNLADLTKGLEQIFSEVQNM